VSVSSSHNPIFHLSTSKGNIKQLTARDRCVVFLRKKNLNKTGPRHVSFQTPFPTYHKLHHPLPGPRDKRPRLEKKNVILRLNVEKLAVTKEGDQTSETAEMLE